MNQYNGNNEKRERGNQLRIEKESMSEEKKQKERGRW